MIKSADLTKLWAAPDNTRLTSKQYSFRLPVHVAAKLAALEDMYPNRTRTEIVGDLLAAALDGVQQGFPSVKGKHWGNDPDTGEEIFEDAGLIAGYAKRVNKYYIQMEKELGNESPKPIFDRDFVVTASELEGK